MRISDWSSDVCSSDLLLSIQGSFDEFNLDLEFNHGGPPLPLKAHAESSPGNLLDFDDPAFDEALNQAMTGLSNVLLKRMADRVSSGNNGKNSYLRLQDRKSVV